MENLHFKVAVKILQQAGKMLVSQPNESFNVVIMPPKCPFVNPLFIYYDHSQFLKAAAIIYIL